LIISSQINRTATDSYQLIIQNESFANQNDVQQTKKFLSELPAACRDSHAVASQDGTIVIRVLCKSTDKAMDGRIEIKNGIVKRIQ
jgi:hypothetical protein